MVERNIANAQQVLSQEHTEIQIQNFQVNQDLQQWVTLHHSRENARAEAEIAQRKFQECDIKLQVHQRELVTAVQTVKRRLSNAKLLHDAFCYWCENEKQPLSEGPEMMLNLFRDLSNQKFHCEKLGHRFLFHNMIPPIAIGWSCCEPVQPNMLPLVANEAAAPETSSDAEEMEETPSESEPSSVAIADADGSEEPEDNQ